MAKVITEPCTEPVCVVIAALRRIDEDGWTPAARAALYEALRKLPAEEGI